MPGYTNYSRLKLDPMWNPLRGDPRFEKIVASLAPKNQGNDEGRAMVPQNLRQ
jgi:hypothetical protein